MKKSTNQGMLFTEDENWQNEWKDMPEYVQEDITSFRRIVVHFRNNADVNKFAKLINQIIKPNQPSLWFPEQEIKRYKDIRYVDSKDENQELL